MRMTNRFLFTAAAAGSGACRAWRLPPRRSAQSAGDDQYVDPFQDDETGNGTRATRTPRAAATTTRPHPTSPPQAPADTGDTAGATPPMRPADERHTLPRTGLPARRARADRRHPPRPAGSRSGERGRRFRDVGLPSPPTTANGSVDRREAPVIIDARAAARREIGGVERVTMEMAARLPRLRPDRYAVMRPPSALAYRAGHLWEQALLPAAARQARVLYCPANLAPAASTPHGGGDQRPRRAAPPRLVLARLRVLPAADPAAAGAPRAAR